MNQKDPLFGGHDNPNLSGKATFWHELGVLLEATGSSTFEILIERSRSPRDEDIEKLCLLSPNAFEFGS